MNGAARYLHDRHRALQLRHLARLMVEIWREEHPPSLKLWRDSLLCAARRTSKHAFLRNEPDLLWSQMASHIIDNRTVTTGGKQFSNPVRLAENAVRREATPSLQRRQPGRSPYGRPAVDLRARSGDRRTTPEKPRTRTRTDMDQHGPGWTRWRAEVRGAKHGDRAPWLQGEE